MKEILIEKAKKCNSVDEVLNLAKSNNLKISKTEAEYIFNKFHDSEGKLSEDELMNVSGGASCGRDSPFEHKEYRSEKDVEFVVKVGQTVERYEIFGNSKQTVQITRCFIFSYINQNNGKKYYIDRYTDSTGLNFERQDIACVH